jgi:hypothetical protein
MVIPEINKKKVEPRTGYKINLRSGETGKHIFTLIIVHIFKILALKRSIRKFVNIVAAHKASTNMFLLRPFLRANVPLKEIRNRLAVMNSLHMSWQVIL